MAYVQVNWSHALKIAAFIVAFFSSFFGYSQEHTLPPYVSAKKLGELICYEAFGSSNGYTVKGRGCGENTVEAKQVACDNASATEKPPNKSGVDQYERPYSTSYSGTTCKTGAYGAFIHTYTITSTNYTGTSTTTGSVSISFSLTDSEPSYTCPPDNPEYFEYLLPFDSDLDGVSESCVRPLTEDETQDLEKNDEYCKSLALDSGNNSAQSMCYSAYNGASCNVEKTTVGDMSYYKGTGSVFMGDCSTSDKPTYDGAGSGNENDSCIYSNGTNYCKANRSKHCNTINGAEICDDGCIDDGTNLFCDTSRHPDVGEDDSNYFDDHGTCSIIAASSSRGYCEDMGGDWDESTDYQETNCPAGGGTCSVPTAGLCAACIDAGGQWTPDNTAMPSEEVKAQNEMIATQNKTNQKLDAIEHGQRKTAESVASTVSRGNEKVVAAIEKLGEQMENEKEEKETYTTTTQDIDKSKINSLFDDAAKAAVQVDIDALKIEYKNLLQSTATDLKNTFTIEVPSTVGYEARTLTLSQGSFDVSLNRFADFFRMLAAPIMLLCSLYALFILLGRS